MKKLITFAPLALLLVVGCGGGGPTPTGTAGPTGASPDPSPAQAVVCLPDSAAGDVNATIVDFDFEPNEPSATAGQRVLWTNTGQAPHTITFDDGPDCGRLNAGGRMVVQFNEAGDYGFHCGIHGTMTGTVRITP